MNRTLLYKQQKNNKVSVDKRRAADDRTEKSEGMRTRTDLISSKKETHKKKRRGGKLRKEDE